MKAQELIDEISEKDMKHSKLIQMKKRYIELVAWGNCYNGN